MDFVRVSEDAARRSKDCVEDHLSLDDDASEGALGQLYTIRLEIFLMDRQPPAGTVLCCPVELSVEFSHKREVVMAGPLLLHFLRHVGSPRHREAAATPGRRIGREDGGGREESKGLLDETLVASDHFGDVDVGRLLPWAKGMETNFRIVLGRRYVDGEIVHSHKDKNERGHPAIIGLSFLQIRQNVTKSPAREVEDLILFTEAETVNVKNDLTSYSVNDPDVTRIRLLSQDIHPMVVDFHLGKTGMQYTYIYS